MKFELKPEKFYKDKQICTVGRIAEENKIS